MVIVGQREMPRGTRLAGTVGFVCPRSVHPFTFRARRVGRARSQSCYRVVSIGGLANFPRAALAICRASALRAWRFLGLREGVAGGGAGTADIPAVYALVRISWAHVAYNVVGGVGRRGIEVSHSTWIEEVRAADIHVAIGIGKGGPWRGFEHSGGTRLARDVFGPSRERCVLLVRLPNTATTINRARIAEISRSWLERPSLTRHTHSVR